MKFGSWTYDGFQLDLQLQDETGGDISSFVTNGEWDLLGKFRRKCVRMWSIWIISHLCGKIKHH